MTVFVGLVCGSVGVWVAVVMVKVNCEYELELGCMTKREGKMGWWRVYIRRSGAV